MLALCVRLHVVMRISVDPNSDQLMHVGMVTSALARQTIVNNRVLANKGPHNGVLHLLCMCWSV